MPASAAAPGITVRPTEVIDFDGAKAIDGQTREAQVFEADARPVGVRRGRPSCAGRRRRVDATLGTDDNAPYRVTVDTEALEAGTHRRGRRGRRRPRRPQAGAQSAAVTVGAEPAPPTPPVGGLQDHLVVHYPKTADVDDLSLWTFGDIAPGQVEPSRTYPNGLEWNGEDEYGVFRYVQLDTSDGKNDDVGVIVVDTTGQQERHQADRTIDPLGDPGGLAAADRRRDLHQPGRRAGLRHESTTHRPDGAVRRLGPAPVGDALRRRRGHASGPRRRTPDRHRRLRRLLAACRSPTPTQPLELHRPQGRREGPRSRPELRPGRAGLGLDRLGRRDRAPDASGRARTSRSCTTHRPAGDYGDYARRTSPTSGACTPGPAPTPPLAWADAEQAGPAGPLRPGLRGRPRRRRDLAQLHPPPGRHEGPARRPVARPGRPSGHEVWILSGARRGTCSRCRPGRERRAR